jgi:small GTP-binding protein
LPAIEDSYRKQVEVDGKYYTLDILDTAGQEEYSALRDTYMRTGDAFILIYSITDPSSFQEVSEIHEQLLRSLDEDDVPVVLVASKCDLEEERSISKLEGQSLANSFGTCTFFESSAKKRVNVEVTFHSVVRLLNQKKQVSCEEPKEKVLENKKILKVKKNKCLIM